MNKIFCVGFVFKIFILLGLIEESECNQKKRERLNIDNLHWEPRGEPPNETAI
jgi:hypothetical protein